MCSIVIIDDVFYSGDSITLPNGWPGTAPQSFGPIGWTSNRANVSALAMKIDRVWTHDYNGIVWLEDMQFYCDPL
jgi:hypothetical protein